MLFFGKLQQKAKQKKKEKNVTKMIIKVDVKRPGDLKELIKFLDKIEDSNKS